MKNFFFIWFISFTVCHSSENVSQYYLKKASKSLEELYSLSSKKNLNDIHFFNDNVRLEWIKSKAEQIPKDSRILDVGAGQAPYKSFFEHCDYKTHDFAQNKDHVRYGNLDYISDILNIPVESESFDVVICTEVLEHVPEPIKALEEISRILKPGGKLLLTAPLGSGLHQLPYHFYGGYTPEWYKTFCPKFNLKINEIKSNGGLFKHLAQECARLTWTFSNHKNFHGNQAAFVKWLFSDFMPRYLTYLDEKCSINDFTVGYFVEAQKTGTEIKNEYEQTFNHSEFYNALISKNLDKINELKLKFKDLIQKDGNGNIYNVTDKNKYSPLMWAATNNYLDASTFLIENGADVNARDKNGCTPLMFACWKGNLEIVELLIKNNANVDLIDINGTSALNFAEQLESPLKEKIIVALIGQEL